MCPYEEMQFIFQSAGNSNGLLVNVSEGTGTKGEKFVKTAKITGKVKAFIV